MPGPWFKCSEFPTQDHPNYNVSKTWAAITYVRESHFMNSTVVQDMDFARCNRTRVREEGARARDEGWYLLKGLEIGYLEIDLRHLPEDLVYNEHYKLAIFVRPSRCDDEVCRGVDRVAAAEKSPCRRPRKRNPAVPWFLTEGSPLFTLLPSRDSSNHCFPLSLDR